MTLQRRSKDAPARPAKQYTGTFTPERPRAVMATNLGQRVAAATPAPKLTRKDRTCQSIRDSARGEACEIRYPGCPSDPAMTIWSHNRHADAGKGQRLKALDLCGAYGCTYCDAIYDGQRPLPEGMTREQAELQWYRAHDRSMVKLAQKGLV